MATKKAEVAAVEEVPAPPPVEKVELLTVEAHPIIGRIERWRMSDGTVQSFEFEQVYVQK